MADVLIESENEEGEGWAFSIRLIDRERGINRLIRMTLSWADYDHWSGGARAPSNLADEVMRFVLARADDASAIPNQFDASTVRRWFRDVDVSLRGR